MNIHITNKETYEALKNASLVPCNFGSHLYHTNDELSDKDIHYVYATSVGEMNSFLKSHHHLQYCEDGIDHVFVNLHTFLSNLIKGDSSVLFEIVHSDAFIGTPLEFIHNMKDAFCNYTIIRSYLGFSNRDFKKYHTKKTNRDQLKALCHIHRGYYFAKSLMEGNFKLVNDTFLQVVKEIKSIQEADYKTKNLFLNEGHNLVKELREELNTKFNNNTLNLPKYMTIENQVSLDDGINELMSKNIWFQKQRYLSDIDLMPLFYDAFENEINY